MKKRLLTRALEVAARLVLTLSILLVLAPPVLAQDPVPSGSYAPHVWAPDNLKWENGLPRGYAETESAAFAVEIKSGLATGTTYYMELGLQASQKGTPTSYGFSDFTPWDVSYQPAALPDGTPVDYGYPAADWDRSHPYVWGYNITIADVQPITYIADSNGNYEMMALVTFTTNGSAGFLVYGGRFAAPGDMLPAPVPADLDTVVPWAQGASTISGTFQARLGSGGDKTVNFKGSDIEPAVASLAIDKVGSETSVEIGETVTYTVTVTNDGQLNLANVVLSDPLLGLNNYLVPGSTGDGNLLSGESVQVVGTYTPDEDDYYNNNPLVNTATADSDWTDPVSDSWSVDITASPALTIDKVGDAGPVGIGDTVHYTVTVENTGDIALSNVTVVDAKVGLDETIATLAVGASQTFYGSYVVVEADYWASPLVNTATADSDQTDPVTDTWSVDVVAAPALAIDKVGGAGPVGIGETVHYTVTVENTGDIALSNVTVVDPMLDLDELVPSLAVGASETFYGTYVVAEADYWASPLVNTATADSAETDAVTDTWSVDVVAAPGLSIHKTGDAGPVGIGDTIQYTITVENTGDIALHNVTVVDAKLAFDESIAELAVGASQTFYPTYGPITENDLPGPVVNTAVADSDETEPVTDTHTVAIETYPALSIDKVGSTTSAGIGETVDYTITVTNIGDVTLTGVSVMDPMLGIVQVGGILLPGASTTVNGSYGPITEDDYLNNNPLVNVAEAYSAETDPVTDTWSVDIVAAPALQIVKTGDESVVVEETVQYTITVTNVGNITLHNVMLSDPMLGLSQNLGTLAPGQSATVYPTYGPVTQDEYENSNPLVNTATADSDETGPVSDDHSVIIVSKPVEPEPGLAIVKTGDAGPVAIGGYVHYQIEVFNTGNITLTNVTVVDAKLAIDENLGSLGVGASSIITGTYGPVTESDLPGPIVNTATADSDQTEPVSDDHSVEIVTAPGLAIDKSGSAVVKVGEYASYTIIVTNTGDVTLYGVWLEDTMLGISQSLGNLDPGESTTVLKSYGPVTQWEYENDNPLVNTASAWAPEQAGPVYDSHTVIIVSEPEEPTPEPPCIRSDVSVIIYGGWGNTPVNAWVGGTEQTKLFSAANSYGQQQVMWTFYPPESGTWNVSVAPELPAGADPDEWSYKLVRIESPTEGWVNDSPTAASVKISRCQQYIIYYQLIHDVPPPPELPKTGASSAPLGMMSREALFGLVGLNLLSGAYLVFRKKRR